MTKLSIQKIVSLFHKEKNTKASTLDHLRKINDEKLLWPNEAIAMGMLQLKEKGIVYRANKWQAIDSPDDMYEIIDFNLKIRMPLSITMLGILCKADLPWAEDHFQERVSGNPANPGYQYQNWPYYKPENHNSTFRAEGQGLFSHTYMERFWPDTDIIGTGAMGYKFGDFNDLLDRLAEDPFTRQAYFAIWHPNDQSNNGVRLPCTIGYQFLIREGKLNIIYTIRSCDIFRHFKNDIYMTIRLAQYVRDELINRGIFKENELGMGHMGMNIGSLHCFNVERSLLETRAKEYSKL